MIENKEVILKCLNIKIKYLEKTIKKYTNPKEKYDKEKMYFAVADVLLWLGVSLGRIENVESTLISSFRGAINAQKHAINLVAFEEEKNEPFSFENFNFSNFSFNTKRIFIWSEQKEDLIDQVNQIKKYNQNLKNKEILSSIFEIEEIIKQEYSKLK